jgi:hypothetical protein
MERTGVATVPTVKVPEVVKFKLVATMLPAVNGFVPKLEAKVDPFIGIPLMKRLPPKYKLPATPTPPETTNAPVLVEIEAVVLLM